MQHRQLLVLQIQFPLLGEELCLMSTFLLVLETMKTKELGQTIKLSWAMIWGSNGESPY